MKILILSKTHFGQNHVCVGGMTLTDNQYVRLLNPGNYYQFSDTNLNIGDIWEVNYSPSNDLISPHNEDVIINSRKFIRTIENISEYIESTNVSIWRGDPSKLFDGSLRWQQNGKGYLAHDCTPFPDHSVGFWKPDKILTYKDGYYLYPTGNPSRARKLIYKGIPEAIEEIRPGKLIRVSLAKWWKPNDVDIEERCYLQLSGWYD